jgi:hypothetical protein
METGARYWRPLQQWLKLKVRARLGACVAQESGSNLSSSLVPAGMIFQPAPHHVSWCTAGLPQSTLLALLATIQYGDLKRMPADSAAWVLLLAAHARCRRTDSRVQACYQELKRSSSRMR